MQHATRAGSACACASHERSGRSECRCGPRVRAAAVRRATKRQQHSLYHSHNVLRVGLYPAIAASHAHSTVL